jgi:hypothetical protein
MKCGNAFPPRIYKYHREKNGQVVREKQQNRIFDNIFLITCFDFPFPYKDESDQKLKLNPTYIMAGIRVLQLLIAFEDYNAEHPLHKIEPIRVSELQKILTNT